MHIIWVHWEWHKHQNILWIWRYKYGTLGENRNTISYSLGPQTEYSHISWICQIEILQYLNLKLSETSLRWLTSWRWLAGDGYFKMARWRWIDLMILTNKWLGSHVLSWSIVDYHGLLFSRLDYSPRMSLF